MEVRYPPLKRGISAILARCPMKTRQMGAIPPSAILSRKAIARYGGVSRHWAAKIVYGKQEGIPGQEGWGRIRAKGQGAALESLQTSQRDKAQENQLSGPDVPLDIPNQNLRRPGRSWSASVESWSQMSGRRLSWSSKRLPRHLLNSDFP